MSQVHGETPDVRTTVTVRASVEQAFRLFTERPGDWLPPAHRFVPDPATVRIEPRAGGRFLERGQDGTEVSRGTVLSWAPPHELTLTWRIGPRWRPVYDDEHASRITARFTPAGADTTEVTLTYRELHRHGAMAGPIHAALSAPGPGESLRRYADLVARTTGNHPVGNENAAPTGGLAAANRRVAEEFRAGDGTVGGAFARLPLVLLTTVGARSGRPRTVPLTYLPHGAAYVVAAAAGGTAKNPAWYHNLVAEPAVTIEVGSRTYDAVARTASAAERRELFDRFAAAYPQLTDYQALTSREVPMVVLTPVHALPAEQAE